MPVTQAIDVQFVSVKDNSILFEFEVKGIVLQFIPTFGPAAKNGFVTMNFALQPYKEEFKYSISPLYVDINYSQFEKTINSCVSGALKDENYTLLRDGILLDVDHHLGYKVVKEAGLLVFASQHKLTKENKDEKKSLKFLAK